MERKFLLFVGVAIMVAGCTPATDHSAPPTVTSTSKPEAPEAKPETAPSAPTPVPTAPNAPVEAQIALDPYIHGQPLTGRVVGFPTDQRLGTLILGMCSSDEWRRAQSEGRPPVTTETVTVDLDQPDGNRFQFGTALDMAGAMMVFPNDPDTKVRVRPVEARPRQGGPMDNAGPVDGVGTTGIGAPPDAHNPSFVNPNR